MSLRGLVAGMKDAVRINDSLPLEYGVTRALLDHPTDPVRFADLKGYEAIGNAWGSRERIASYLNIPKQQIPEKMLEAIASPLDPVVADDPPFAQRVSEDFDLRELPIPKWFPEDGGRYITSAVAVAQYRGKKNLSFHRLMLLDRRRFAIRLVPRHLYTMHRASLEEGKDLPVAFAIGVCPCVLLAAATSLDYSQDEMAIASALRAGCLGEPVKVGKTETGILVPAYSEMVLEGRITSKTVEEGPFVDITGTYDKKRVQPVVEIDRIYTTANPIFHLILPGGLEHYLLMGLPREPIIHRTVGQVVPRVNGVRLTEGGCCWLHGVVSITKNKEGDGINAILAAFSGHPSMKKVVIVDGDVDIYDDRQVEWAVATRFQAGRGLVVIGDAAGSSLDPSSDGLTSKVGLDATKPLGAEGFDKATVP